MKLQASEIPLGRPQSRRKTTKIAPLLISLTVLFTIILVYYPLLRYNVNFKKINAAIFSFDSLDESIKPASMSAEEQNNEPPKETELGDVEGRQESPKEKDKSETTKPPEIDPARLPSSTNGGLAIAESMGKKYDPMLEQVGSGERSRQGDSGNVKGGGKPARRFPSLRGDGSMVASKLIGKELGCNLFSGEWVPNPEEPYYTNLTCWAIQEHQNCMKFGRPDTGYLKWRWKPDGCDLPLFDPQQFLELVRGKSIAFVGDSVARNHMQSLICLLSKVSLFALLVPPC